VRGGYVELVVVRWRGNVKMVIVQYCSNVVLWLCGNVVKVELIVV
jgi:hypothetical protein